MVVFIRFPFSFIIWIAIILIISQSDVPFLLIYDPHSQWRLIFKQINAPPYYNYTYYNSSHFKNLPCFFKYSRNHRIKIIIINQFGCFRSISIPFYLYSILILIFVFLMSKIRASISQSTIHDRSTISIYKIDLPSQPNFIPLETLHSVNRVFRPRYRVYLSSTTACRRTNATDNKRRSVDWGKRGDGSGPSTSTSMNFKLLSRSKTRCAIMDVSSDGDERHDFNRGNNSNETLNGGHRCGDNSH